MHLAEWFGRDVAVKRAKIDPSNLGLIDDFIKEISMLIKLQHPCIVRIFYYYPQVSMSSLRGWVPLLTTPSAALHRHGVLLEGRP